MKDTENKLTGKDLMYIGIYGAIYYVIVFIVAMLGVIPILYPMLAVICPIVGGIPFMLFLTKVKKFGMIWILSVLMGLMMLISGMGWYSLAMSVITGLVSELIYKSGNYQSAKSVVITNGTFSLWVWANMLPLFINRTEFLASRESKVGAEYVEKLNTLTPDWICPVLLGICFVSGIVGGIIGKAMLSKHFKEAGIV